MMNRARIMKLAALWRTRGQSLAKQGAVLITLLDKSPVDLSSLLGPVLLIDQGYARAQVEVLSLIMSDADYQDFPLLDQGEVARLAVLWNQVLATLGSLSFTHRLPTLLALTETTPEAARLGSNAGGVAIATRLERLANAAQAAGLSFDMFWSMTAAARVSLSRLAVMDLALSRSYEFDPLDEVTRCLLEGTPWAPDVDALLRTVNLHRVPRYSEIPVLRSTIRTIPDNTSIQALAQLFYGRADRWRDLVEYNGLRPPYISTNPIDRLGDAQRTLVLIRPTLAGSAELDVEDVIGVYPDQRIGVDVDGLVQISLIEAVDPETNTITVAEAFTSDVPDDAVLTLYSPVYDVVGQVLSPGDRIIVPLTGEIEAAHVAAVHPDATPSDRLYGADVALDNAGRLSTDRQNIATVSGVQNLVQAIRNRFQVPRGSFLLHPRYGSGLEDMIGAVASQFRPFLIYVEAHQVMLSDPRIAKVDSLDVTQEGDVISVDVTGTTTNNEQFPSTRISYPLR